MAFKTFTVTPRAAPIPLLLAAAIKEGLPLDHFDTEQAFVRSDIDAENDLRLPPGCGPLSQKIVKLNKGVYRFRQASRSWPLLLSSKLESFVFDQSLLDPCVFRPFAEGSKHKLTLVVIAYLDLIVAGKDKHADPP